MIRVIAFALYGPLAASTRYRLEQYIPFLKLYGIDLKVKYLLNDNYLKSRYDRTRLALYPIIKSYIARIREISDLRNFDIAIVYGELLPLFPSFIERHLIKIPYIYDFDDAFYLKYRLNFNCFFKYFFDKKIDLFINGATAVCAGNSYLFKYAAKLNKRVLMLPTAVNIKRYKKINLYKSKKKFTIGWIGSPSTEKYLSEIIKPISIIGKQTFIKLIVVGGKAPNIPGVEVEELAWSERDEIMLINSFDVGIMPLPLNEWTKGKCAFKLIQYMACGVPVIASRVGANIDVVPKKCGFLVSSEKEWVDALIKLHDNKHLRNKMGEASRKKVTSEFSALKNASILADLILKSTS
jgi:glycosyltransferase involved in cell wall biosynthesis